MVICWKFAKIEYVPGFLLFSGIVNSFLDFLLLWRRRSIGVGVIVWSIRIRSCRSIDGSWCIGSLRSGSDDGAAAVSIIMRLQHRIRLVGVVSQVDGTRRIGGTNWVDWSGLTAIWWHGFGGLHMRRNVTQVLIMLRQSQHDLGQEHAYSTVYSHRKFSSWSPFRQSGIHTYTRISHLNRMKLRVASKFGKVMGRIVVNFDLSDVGGVMLLLMNLIGMLLLLMIDWNQWIGWLLLVLRRQVAIVAMGWI